VNNYKLVKLCTPQFAWLLKRLAFADVGEWTSSWHQNTNCCRATVVCLDAKGLWKPGQCFISVGFTLSLPRSAPCATEQATIDTGCDPGLLRNCIDHFQPSGDFNLFNKCTLIKFAIIRPSSANNQRNLWNCPGVPNETTCLTGLRLRLRLGNPAIYNTLALLRSRHACENRGAMRKWTI